MNNTDHPQKRSRWLKWSALGASGLLALLLIGLFTLDLGFLRGAIEDRVRDATGRPFAIAGPVSIRLGRELRFSAEGVSLGNPEWAGPEPMARIAKVAGRVNTRSLLGGRLIVHELVLDGLQLELEQDADGRANWLLAPADEAAGEGPGLLLEELQLSNSSVRVESQRLDQPLLADIASYRQLEAGDGFLEADIQARLNDRPVAFKGRAGPAESLASGDDIVISGEGALGQTRLQVQAEFDQLWSPRRPHVALSLQGPELAELTTMLGIEGLGSGPLDLRLGSQPAGDRLELLAQGRLGELTVDVTASLPSLADTRDSQFSARVEGPNFGRLARLAGVPGWPERPFTLATQLRRPGDGLEIQSLDIALADARLSLSGQLPGFPGLAGAALTLSAEGRDIAPFEAALGLADLPRGAFRISGQVQSGDDESARLGLDYRFPMATGRITGTLGGGADLLGTDLHIEGQGPDALAFGNSLGLPGLPSAPWTVGLDLAISQPGHYRLGDLAFKSGGLDVRLDGRLDAALPKERFTLDFRLSGPRLSALQGFVGDAAELPALPFRAEGRVDADRARWRLEAVQGTAGETAFKASGTLGWSEGYAGTELTLSATGKDLGQLASLPGPARLPGGPYELATQLKLAPGALELNALSLTAGALSVNANAALPWPLDATGGRFTLQAHGEDISRILPELSGMAVKRNGFDADFKGAWTEQALALERATARIGEARFSGQGTLTLPSGTASSNMALDASAPRPGQLLEASGKPWADLPLALQASFEGTGKRLRAPSLRAQLGANTVTGRLEVNFEGEQPRFDLALQADALDLRPFQPEPSTGAVVPPGTRIIPEQAYPMDALASVSGAFNLSAKRLALRQGAFRDVRIAGSLADGGLQLGELGMSGYKGRFTANLGLVPANGQARLSGRLQLQDFVLDQDGLTAEQKAASPAFNADIQFDGRGAGLRETAASLSGSISIESQGGRFYRKKKEAARAPLLPAILAAIKPELARQDALVLACVAGSARIASGRINLEPGFFAYTDKLKVQAVGNINLANEQLDLSVRTQERKNIEAGSESFSPALKVSGTLAAHEIGLDRKATLLSGSASFLKGGLSDLAKFALDKDSGGSDPCAEMLRKRAEKMG